MFLWGKKENEIFIEKLTKFSRVIVQIIARLTAFGSLIEYLFELEIEKLLFELMKFNCNQIKCHLWHALGNMASSSSDLFTQRLLELDISDNILSEISKDIKLLDVVVLKEIIFLITNICAGTISQIGKMIDSGIINRIIDICYEISLLDLYDIKNKIYLQVILNFKRRFIEKLFMEFVFLLLEF